MVANGIFESWRKSVNEGFGTSKFTAVSRQEVLEDLVQMLVEVKIPYGEAEMLKTNLKTFLVTKKGSTGSGNYKGWKEAVEGDFLRILYEVYKDKNLLPISEDQPTSNNTTSSKPATNNDELERHPHIEMWGKAKFGEIWTDELSILTNTPDTSLHNMFLDEFYS